MSNSGPSNPEQRLRDLLAASTLRLVAEGAGVLLRYAEVVVEHSRQVNLTAAKTLDAALDILVVPSLGVQAAWPESEPPPDLAIDIGSGNGFPGVAVAVSWPTCDVVLIERRAKKARAIQACLEQVGIANAEALSCDAREIKNEAPVLMGAADLVTLRAVGPLDETTRLAAPLLAEGGRVVHWKKADVGAAERRAGAKAARDLGLEVLPDVRQPACDGVLIAYRMPDA